MQLYFVRHGQSENNLLWERSGDSVGRSDDPWLTAAGRKQAEQVARFLRSDGARATTNGSDPQNKDGFGITHVYCSLMVRAVETGNMIAQALQLPLVAWPDLHEGGGIYLDDPVSGQPEGRAGKGRSFFAQHYPHLVLPTGLSEQGWWNRPYEMAVERMPRAQRWLRELIARHGATDDRVVAVSHGLFYNCVVAAVLNLPGPDAGVPWFALNNTAVTRIDFRGDERGVGVMYMNRVDFLPRALLTE